MGVKFYTRGDGGDWPFRATANPVDLTTLFDMQVWCKATFKEGEWISTGQRFNFKNVEDRQMFILRWV